MAYSNKFNDKKIKFLRKYFAISEAVFSGYYSQAIEVHKKKLLILARRHLKYSKFTYNGDILRGLKASWGRMDK